MYYLDIEYTLGYPELVGEFMVDFFVGDPFVNVWEFDLDYC